jgi:small subunit ribosomal protein S21
MIIIPIKENEPIERALKKFKKKFDKTGAIRQLRERKQFTKKSVKRREEVQKAAYVQKLRDAEELG